MIIRIKTTGLNQTIKRLKRSSRGDVARGIKRIAGIVFEGVLDEAPQRTGKFIRTLKKVRTGPLSWNIVEGSKLGGLIRRGSPRHPIYPKKKGGALYWSGLPHPVSRVSHPGFKGNQYPARAVSKTAGPVRAEAERVGVDIKVRLED